MLPPEVNARAPVVYSNVMRIPPIARSVAGALLLSLSLALLASCNPRDVVRDLRSPPATEHERYARSLTDAGLAESALGRDWLLASDSALRAPLQVVLPLRESGFYSRAEARAVAYRLTVPGGQRLALTLRAEGLPALLFLDLFEQTGDSVPRFEHRASARPQPFADTVAAPDSGRRSASAASRASADTAPVAAVLALDFEAERTGVYILRLQPELLRDGRFELTVRTEPILAFPVEGRDNGAVQSFFGANRDAGRRSHAGIDIFAPRGTPVLAATDGVVRSTSPNDLGGNVVWLSDPQRRQSLYYAHLDRHAVTPGQVVRAGDTLGFVGNTGNARTTPPHLHFGIYRRGEGAVDPWPWVRRERTAYPRLAADTSRLGTSGRTIAANAPLLVSPSVRGDTLRRITRNTELQLVGAAGAWYRVQLPDGVAGYLPARSIGGL